MRTGKRELCLLLSAAMTVSILTGCAQAQGVFNKAVAYMEPNQTISADSKWVNSDVAGVVTADTSVSEKDDFATAMNKDWLLSVADRTNETGSVSVVDENTRVVTQQKLTLLHTAIDGTGFAENKVGMEAADYNHMTDEFTKIVSTVADWDARNAAGLKPLERYLSEIEAISSLDQMSEYLRNEKGTFLSNAYLIPFMVATSPDETKNRYVVTLTSRYENSMDTEVQSANLQQDYVMEAVTDILTQLGYPSSEAKNIVKQCWQLETALGECTAYQEISEALRFGSSFQEQFDHTYTAEELAELSGAYPLMEILKTYHYDQLDSYVVYEPDYVKGVAKLYQEKNLNQIKSYYLVHTVLSAMPLLTRDYYDQYEAYFTDTKKEQKSSTEEEPESQESQENPENMENSESQENPDSLSEDDRILMKFVTTYLNEMFEEMYLTNYCSAEQKSYVENLIREAIAEYETILAGEDWLSEETRDKAIEKLNAITPKVFYPDELKTCNELQTEAGNLLDMVAKLQVYNLEKEADRIDKTVDRTQWDLSRVPTTDVNAYYFPSENAIVILAGIAASKELFDIQASDEENMAHLGYIIGHEISHAFDTNGYLYDKDGNEVKWWTDADEETFQARASKLANYYSSFKCFRNAGNINGEQVQGEGIADIGGMKCMLAIGKQKEGFDYRKFFCAFAHTWATSRTYAKELQVVTSDSHPLPFLRINVTAQQFEEFYEAFDIQPGDGMYLAPEKRISVW